MTRLSLSAVILSAALGASGCAHCDTCDDFPAPAAGSTWSGAYYDGPALSPPTSAPAAAPAASLGPVNDAAPAAAGDAKPSATDSKPATESKPSLEPSTPSRPVDPFRAPRSGS